MEGAGPNRKHPMCQCKKTADVDGFGQFKIGDKVQVFRPQKPRTWFATFLPQPVRSQYSGGRVPAIVLKVEGAQVFARFDPGEDVEPEAKVRSCFRAC